MFLCCFQRLPDAAVACVGGGSNAIGLFHPFLADRDVKLLGVEAGGIITLTSRRGTLTAYGRADRGVQRGVLFMPFAYNEAAANLLTNDAIDPFGKIPEFKFCAARVTPVAANVETAAE